MKSFPDDSLSSPCRSSGASLKHKSPVQYRTDSSSVELHVLREQNGANVIANPYTSSSSIAPLKTNATPEPNDQPDRYVVQSISPSKESVSDYSTPLDSTRSVLQGQSKHSGPGSPDYCKLLDNPGGLKTDYESPATSPGYEMPIDSRGTGFYQPVLAGTKETPATYQSLHLAGGSQSAHYQAMVTDTKEAPASYLSLNSELGAQSPGHYQALQPEAVSQSAMYQRPAHALRRDPQGSGHGGQYQALTRSHAKPGENSDYTHPEKTYVISEM